MVASPKGSPIFFCNARIRIWPVAGATVARLEGRFLGNNRRQGDVAPADRWVKLPVGAGECIALSFFWARTFNFLNFFNRSFNFLL
jgi:hypothetical protein